MSDKIIEEFNEEKKHFKNNINYKRDSNEKIYIYEPDKNKFFKNKTNISENLKKETGKKSINILNFSSQKGAKNFSFTDFDAVEQRKQKIISGEAEKNAFETLNNFSSEEIETKLLFMMKIANNENNKEEIANAYNEYNIGFTDFVVENKIKVTKKDEEVVFKESKKDYNEENADIIAKKLSEKYRREKNFFDTFEILEEFSEPKSGVSGYVVGNKKTGKTEIFFAGSNDPRTFFKNSNTAIDWSNNARSGFSTPPNYKEALRIALKYRNGYKGYGPLDTVNGHSKGGGEAIYVASRMNIKALVNDPAPVIEPGNYINSNKILAIIPGNGDGTLNSAVKIPGSEFYTMEAKTGISLGKGKNKTTAITAIPAPNYIETKKAFGKHFSNPEKAALNFEETKKYASKIKSKYEDFYKNIPPVKFSSKKEEIGKILKPLNEKESSLKNNKKVR